MVFSAEQFNDMIKILDKDGDGSVDKIEFHEEYSKMFPDIGPVDGQKFMEIWAQMDKDGSDSLEVAELAAYYGFNMGDNSTYEMSDDQILELLQLQVQLDALNAASRKTAEAPEKKAPRATVDKTIKVIKMEKGIAPDMEEQQDFLICCAVGDLTPELNKDLSARTFLDDDRLDAHGVEKIGAINIRVQDESGDTALHKIARHASDKHVAQLSKLFHDIIRLMRLQVREAKGPTASIQPDINHQNKDGKTPLFVAVEFKNMEMIRLLYELRQDGPDTLLVNSNGWTVFHMAVFSNDMTVFKHLLSVGQFSTGRIRVLLQTQDKSGRNPLHIAAYKCTEEMCGFLVDLGATDKDVDNNANTPTELAEKCFLNSGDKQRRASKEIIEKKITQREGRASEEDMGGSVRTRKKSKELYDPNFQ